MFSSTQTIVIISFSVIASLFILLLCLLGHLYKLRQRNREYSIIQDQILIVPRTKNSKERVPNRMVQILSNPDRNQLSTDQQSDISPASSYCSNRSGTTGSYFPHHELLNVPEPSCGYTSASSEASLVKSNSEESNESVDTSKVTMSKFETTMSSEELNEEPKTQNEAATLEFNINYFSSTATLNVTVIRINAIPAQFRKHCSSFVKVSLKAFNKLKTKRYKTKTIRNSLNPLYDQELSFKDYEFDELKNFRIRFSCYAKSRTLGKRLLVGDLYVPLSRPDFEPNILLGCREQISLACPITGKRGPQITAGELGFLSVELQYTRDNHRLKVMVRKAQNLPTKSSAPEFYVIISLIKQSEALTYKETRPSYGSNPAFNQPFLFYLDEGNEDDYWLQFLIMRGRLYSKDGAVGQVLIGGQGGLVGRAHWDQVLDEESEIAKWHEVVPLPNSCTG